MDDNDSRIEVTMKFMLPRDRYDFKTSSNASAFRDALWDVDQKCRSAIKYGHDGTVSEFADSIRDLIREEVNLDEYM